MKRLSLLLILTMLLSACSAAATITAPTSTPTAIPATATATEIAPSMENLPAEWQGKIDHVETLADGRVVAVAKLTDAQVAAGLKPQFRELQWDDAKGEWIPYVPKVGLINVDTKVWDTVYKGWAPNSDEMTGPELSAIAAKPIYGVGGQEIKPGLVSDFNDYTVFCGDIVETHQFESGNGVMVIRVPQATGDLELFYVPYVVNYGPGWVGYAFNRDTIDPSLLIDPFKYQNVPMGKVVTEYPMGSTPTLGKAYQLALAEATPVRLVFAVNKTALSAGGNDSTAARRGLIAQWMTGDAINVSGILVNLDNPAMVPEAEYQP